MIVPFVALASLMALIPAFLPLDGVWVIGAVSAILAAALTVTAIALPDTSLTRLTRLLRPVLILVLVVPALWMLLQASPMPARALANPMWASAAAALNERVAGAITVDIGATLISLAQYCAVVAAALVTTAVTLDRQRARHILIVLVVIATLIAVQQIALEVAWSDPPTLKDAGDGWAQASVVSLAGILLSCAAAIDSVDQLRRAGRPRQSRTRAVSVLSGAILSLFVCAAAILVRANPAAVIAALTGIGILLAVFAIRQWFLGPWGVAGLAAAAAIGLLGAFAAIPVKKDADLSIALSMQTQAATERMLPDVAPVGYGAGTFGALLPVYREIGEMASHEHPTAAAEITIEMGRAFFFGLILVTLFGAWTLFHRSLSRGQDYVYAAAGAGALISLTIMAFVNGGILNFGASLMIGVLCGLAFAQSLSGAARDVTPFAQRGALDRADDPHGKGQPARSPTFNKALPRVALAVFGLLLITQAVWILSAESYSQDHFWSSTEKNVGSIGARREETRKAASIAMMRGDLWAESAFALVALPWTDPAAELDRDNDPETALKAFARTLHYSPHRGDVWLMLAAFANRRPAGYGTGALLKMSYYTAPNELGLLPLRLYVALCSDNVVSEPELREMVKRDVSLVLSRLPALRPALVAAYRTASVDGKIFAERLISEVDPGYLKRIRTQYP
jgi:hypothetical protein